MAAIAREGIRVKMAVFMGFRSRGFFWASPQRRIDLKIESSVGVRDRPRGARIAALQVGDTVADPVVAGRVEGRVAVEDEFFKRICKSVAINILWSSKY